MQFRRLVLVPGLALGLVTACSSDDGSGSSGGNPARDTALTEARGTYSRVVLASYEDTLEATQDLDAAIQAFVDAPSEDALDTARDAWLAAREPYLQTEAFRFYDGPIDNPDDGPEGLINAWPLDEVYIDYVAGDDDAGLINDPSQAIDADALLALNEQGGEKNIATGFHAIEFLLWGQDQAEDGPGARPYTDFVDGGTAANQDRRREYLSTLSGLLVTQLQALVDAWAQDSDDNYRAEFEAAAPSESLRRMLTGLIVLSGFETGGERLQTAYDTGDQEDEHSCFSDNTHRDMVQDVRGMQNVWLGRYERSDGSEVSGASIADAVALEDAALAESVSARIAESLELAEALQAPFDREIAFDNEEGRARVLALIEALRAQEDALFDVFSAYELSVELPE